MAAGDRRARRAPGGAALRPLVVRAGRGGVVRGGSGGAARLGRRHGGVRRGGRPASQDRAAGGSVRRGVGAGDAPDDGARARSGVPGAAGFVRPLRADRDPRRGEELPPGDARLRDARVEGRGRDGQPEERARPRLPRVRGACPGDGAAGGPGVSPAARPRARRARRRVRASAPCVEHGLIGPTGERTRPTSPPSPRPSRCTDGDRRRSRPSCAGGRRACAGADRSRQRPSSARGARQRDAPRDRAPASARTTPASPTGASPRRWRTRSSRTSPSSASARSAVRRGHDGSGDVDSGLVLLGVRWRRPGFAGARAPWSGATRSNASIGRPISSGCRRPPAVTALRGQRPLGNAPPRLPHLRSELAP